MITSFTIGSVYLGNNVASAIYLGSVKVWPLTSGSQFWSNFDTNSCVSLNITSSSNTTLANGISWGDGAISGIQPNNNTYKHAFGAGVC
jgi:hypothetical protein